MEVPLLTRWTCDKKCKRICKRCTVKLTNTCEFLAENNIFELLVVSFVLIKNTTKEYSIELC